MNKQEYLLACLAEECDEVGQRCMKALRFSLGEVQDGQQLNNAERVVEELHDLVAVALLLYRTGALPGLGVMPSEETIEKKRRKIEKFMAISREHGALVDQPIPRTA